MEATGADVTGVSAGDRVVLSYNSCGGCARCAAGRRAYCERFAALNNAGRRPDGSSTLSRQGGDVWSSFFGQSSFARNALATRENIVVVPQDTDLVTAAPMGCGFQTGAGSVVNLLRPTPDSSLVVFGAGGVGLAAVTAASAPAPSSPSTSARSGVPWRRNSAPLTPSTARARTSSSRSGNSPQEARPMASTPPGSPV